MPNNVRTWLVERTYSDDGQNIIILVYAISDGMHYHRKERSLMSFKSDVCDTYAVVDALKDESGRAVDEETRESYAAATTEMAKSHEPTSTV